MNTLSICAIWAAVCACDSGMSPKARRTYRVLAWCAFIGFLAFEALPASPAQVREVVLPCDSATAPEAEPADDDAAGDQQRVWWL